MRRIQQHVGIIALALALAALPARQAQAIPVIDVANLAQSIINALENINQTITAIRNYRNQLLQYQELIRNTVATPVYIYDQVDSIQHNIVGLVDDIRNYRQFIDQIVDWTDKLDDLEYYRTAACYGGDAHCTVSTWQRIMREEQQRANVDSRYRTDSMARLQDSIRRHDERIVDGTRRLEILRRTSRNAEGQLQAMQAGNELSAAAVEELLQLRAALNAYHRVLILERQVELDKEARAKAANERFRRQVYVGEDIGALNLRGRPQGATNPEMPRPRTTTRPIVQPKKPGRQSSPAPSQIDPWAQPPGTTRSMPPPVPRAPTTTRPVVQPPGRQSPPAPPQLDPWAQPPGTEPRSKDTTDAKRPKPSEESSKP